MMKMTPLLWWRHAIALVIGLGLGLLVSRQLSEAGRAAAGPEEESIASRKPLEESGEVPGDAVPVTTLDQLEQRLQHHASRYHPQLEWQFRHEIYQLAEEDLPAALELILRQPNLNRESPMRHLFTRWAEVAPVEALAVGQALKDGQMRFLACYQVLTNWMVLDPESALDHMEEHGTYGESEDTLWRHLAHADADKALELAASRFGGDEKKRREMEDDIVYALANSDPERAVRWVFENRAGDTLVKDVGRVLSPWARFRPEAAMDYLSSLPDEFHQPRVYGELGRTISLRGQELGLEIAESLPDDRKEPFLAGVVRGLAMDTAEHHAPANAAAVAESLPEGSARASALATVALRWADSDLHEASEWVGNLPRSPSRDSAVSMLVHRLTDTDPEAATIWALDIDGDQKRSTALEQSLRSWVKKDRPAAELWFGDQAAETIPEALRRKFFK